MKHTLFAVLILMIAVSLSLGQFTTKVNNLGGNGVVVTAVCTTATTATHYSKPFTLAGFLESTLDSNYANLISGTCISIQYMLDTLNINNGTEVDNISLILQGSFTGSDNWATAATVSSTLAHTALTYGTIATGTAKYPYYRWKVLGNGTNTASIVTINLYAYRKR
jgi:hypothetical protein